VFNGENTKLLAGSIPARLTMQYCRKTNKKQMKEIKLSAYNSTDLFEQVIQVEQNTTENVIANVVGNFFRYHKTMKNIGVKVFKGSEPILLKFEAENINVDLGLLSLKVQQRFKLQNNYKSRVKFHTRLLETTKYIVETAYMKPIKTKDVETFIESLG